MAKDPLYLSVELPARYYYTYYRKKKTSIISQVSGLFLEGGLTVGRFATLLPCQTVVVFFGLVVVYHIDRETSSIPPSSSSPLRDFFFVSEAVKEKNMVAAEC